MHMIQLTSCSTQNKLVRSLIMMPYNALKATKELDALLDMSMDVGTMMGPTRGCLR
jgi:hypothetical protein